jgi:acyl-CoA thioesterase FadM
MLLTHCGMLSTASLTTGAASVALLALLREWWRALPLAFHARAGAGLAFARMLAPRLPAPGAATLARGRVALSDMSWAVHSHNAQYFLEADVARFAWLGRFLSPAAWARLRFSVGGCSFSFLREMRYGQRWALETRCVGFDRKWLYLRHTFFDEARARRAGYLPGADGATGAAVAGAAAASAAVADAATAAAAAAAAGAAQPPADCVFAIGLSRVVLKEASGREAGRTLPPGDVLALCGFGEAPPAGWGEGRCTLGAAFDALDALQLAELAPATHQPKRRD